MRFESVPEVLMRKLNGARRWVAKRLSPDCRTVLLPMIVQEIFVQTQSTSLVRTGIGLVAAMKMFVNWLVNRTVSEKIVSSARWMRTNALVCTLVLAAPTRFLTLMMPLMVNGCVPEYMVRMAVFVSPFTSYETRRMILVGFWGKKTSAVFVATVRLRVM